MKKILLTLLLIVLAVSLVFGACAKPAPTPVTPVTLKFATFDPPAGFVSKCHQDWANELEKRTGGRYKVEIAWSAAMGPMDAHYELARDGIADISYSTADAAGFHFGLLSTMPWIDPTFDIAVKSYWELFKRGYFDKEFAETHPLFVWNGTGSALYSTKPINSIADLKGMKVAAGIGYAFEVIKAMGGTPVTLTLGEQFGALEKGVVDATWLVWVAVIPFHLQEVTKYCVEPTFGNMQCQVVMNKNVYNNLPDDVKKIVDEMCEEILLPGTIEGYAAVDAAGRKVFADAGGKVTTWSEADLAEMDRIVAPFWEEWIAKMEAEGFKAREAVDALWHIKKDMGVEKPAFGYTPK